jgi:hypothetical protein
VIRFLHENGVDLTRKDSRGLTPLQSALGEAGGFGGRAAGIEGRRSLWIGVPLSLGDSSRVSVEADC